MNETSGSRIGSLLRWSTGESELGHGLVVAEDAEQYQIAPLAEAASKSADASCIPVGQADFPPLAGTVVRANRTFWAPKATCEEVGRAGRDLVDRVLRALARSAVRSYHSFAHERSPDDFVGGSSPVPVSGRVFGSEEMENLAEAALDFWLTTGRFNDAFERRFAGYLGVPHVLTTNSGSSANLLAVSALTSPKLGDRRLVPGDEVLTVAAGFPTTVNPLLQNGLVPVFVDVDVPTYNVRPDLLEAALGERTRAIVLAHTLGNPFDVEAVLGLARKHDLWVIEDCCDALGSRYRLSPDLAGGDDRERLCGTFGHLATFSFYPAHHITMGEGGAIATADPLLKKIVESFRDWGRDCWCAPGHDDTCRRRFDWKFGELPEGYDHKYVYSHVGYNLKITDMQASVALAQMDRLPEFIRTRNRNFAFLTDALSGLSDCMVLPEATDRSEPSWFGYPITLRRGRGGSRNELLRFLNDRKIGTRLLFGGNLVKQPYFQGQKFRVATPLRNTDRIMDRTFWVGLFPGLGVPHLEHTAASIRRWFGCQA